MSSTSTILITGANRGLGHALVATYLARPHSTVIAGVRDPNHATSKNLSSLPKSSSSHLIVVKIDSMSESDAAATVKHLQSTYHVTGLEIVIANAGISKVYPTVATVNPADIQEHVAVNVIGPALLFQAVLPLLHKGSKFVAMGSSSASIGAIELRPVPNAAYGASKTMLNYIIRKAHFEHEDLIIFPIDPGWVQTDMGNRAAVILGLGDSAEITTEESVKGLVSVIDGATREKTSGHFLTYDGTESTW